MKALLSNHARQRLAERTKLTEEQLIQLLDRFQTASLGYNPKLHLWYRLFYSPKDRKHFVAVQTLTGGEIVTILPIHFAACVRLNITRKQLRRTVLAAAPDHHAEIYQKSTPEVPGVRYELTGIFWDAKMQSMKKNLGTFAFDSEPSAEEVLNCEPLIATALQRLQDRRLKGLELNEIVLADKRGKLQTHKLSWTVLQESLPINDTNDENNETNPTSGAAAGTD